MLREAAHGLLALAGPLGAILLFALPGWALTELFPALRRRAPARRAAFGYLLGVGTVAAALFLLSHVFGVPLRPPAIWAAVAVPTVAGATAAALRRVLGRDRGRNRDQQPHPHASLPPEAHATASDGAAAILAAAVRANAHDDAERGHPHRPRFGAAGAARGRRWSLWLQAAAAAAAALICCGVLAEAAINPVHDWDGRMTWDTQARYLRAAATVDAPVLQNERWFVTHPQYPPLLPLAQVAVLEVFHADPDSHLIRAVYAAFLPVLLLLVYDGARPAAGATLAAWTALAAAVIPFFTIGEGGAFSTYSDLPLACFYGAALLLLLSPRPRIADGVAAGLLLAAATLAKNEGIALAVLAVAIGWRASAAAARSAASAAAARVAASPVGSSACPPAVASPASATSVAAAGAADTAVFGTAIASASVTAPARRRRRAAWRGGLPRHLALVRIVTAALGVALAFALLASWRADIPNRQDEGYTDLLRTSDLGRATLTRVAVFGPVLLRQMLRMRQWAGFWLMAPALLLAGRRALRHPRARRWAVAAAGPLLLGCAAYSVSVEPRIVAAVTWERFLLQGSVPVLLLLAAAAAEVARHLSRRRAAAGPVAGPAAGPAANDAATGPSAPAGDYGGKAELSSPPQ